MDIKLINSTLSDKRFNKYLQRCGGDFYKALKYYEFNVLMGQSCHIALEGFEVLLRNRIHVVFTRVFQTDEWYNQWLTDEEYDDFHGFINEAIAKLESRGEEVNPGKMVAEFTLGFWIKLFNQDYDRLLWKHLKNVFNRMSKDKRQRGFVAGNLNRARMFRNRINHYEPISWNINALYKSYANLFELMNWIYPDYAAWVKTRCVFEDTIDAKSKELKESGIINMELQK